jgi:predicted amino acid racemase
MLSQVPRVIASADVSFNTELTVIEALSQEAHHTGRTHGVILMVELGDRREGIMPNDLLHSAQQTLSMQAIELKGIGTNLACLNGVAPDANNMAELSSLVHLIESTFQIHLELISGGNSANMDWALGSNPLGRINNLRFGEAILLGCETLHRQPIKGLFDDAFTLVAEVIESKLNPTQPHGTLTQAAFASAWIRRQQGQIESAYDVRQKRSPLLFPCHLQTTARQGYLFGLQRKGFAVSGRQSSPARSARGKSNRFRCLLPYG